MSETGREASLRHLIDNQEAHAAHCAKVKSKTGKIVPFIWNRAQRYAHELLEKQRETAGILFISHDVAALRTLCGTVYVMEHGMLTEQGTMQ